MLFNSWIFCLFFLVVLGVYWPLPRRWQNRWLILAGYIFYGMWDYRFLLLLFGTTTIDYWVGRGLAATDDARRRRRILTISIVANLGVLGFFKYFNFFATSTIALFGAVGLHLDPPLLHVILPVG